MPAILNVSATLGAVLVGCFVAIACVDHPSLVCSLLTRDADSRELWPSKHAFTFGCTHLINRCTKLWCVILSFNASNTLTSRRSLWFGEQWNYASKPLGMLSLVAGYWILPTLVLYAPLFGTISFQTSGTWKRVFREMFHRKPKQFLSPSPII